MPVDPNRLPILCPADSPGLRRKAKQAGMTFQERACGGCGKALLSSSETAELAASRDAQFLCRECVPADLGERSPVFTVGMLVDLAKAARFVRKAKAEAN